MRNLSVLECSLWTKVNYIYRPPGILATYAQVSNSSIWDKTNLKYHRVVRHVKFWMMFLDGLWCFLQVCTVFEHGLLPITRLLDIGAQFQCDFGWVSRHKATVKKDVKERGMLAQVVAYLVHQNKPLFLNILPSNSNHDRNAPFHWFSTTTWPPKWLPVESKCSPSSWYYHSCLQSSQFTSSSGGSRPN
jgi:hypothetical protein